MTTEREEAANKERTMECEISVCSECGDRTRDPSCFFRCPRCGDVCCPDHISEHDCKTREQEQVDGLEPGWVKLLRSKLAEQAAEIERLKNAYTSQERDISQTLGKALGYQWFKDDQANWPDATEADGVCVGEHVAESLADEAAKKLADLQSQLAARDAMLAAATDAVAFFFQCQIAIQLPGHGPDVTYGFDALRDGRFAVTQWKGNRQFFHIENTPMAAMKAAAGWLKPSPGEAGTGGAKDV